MWIEVCMSVLSFLHTSVFLISAAMFPQPFFVLTSWPLTVTVPTAAMKGGALLMLAFVLLNMGPPDKGTGDGGKEDDGTRRPPGPVVERRGQSDLQLSAKLARD